MFGTPFDRPHFSVKQRSKETSTLSQRKGRTPQPSITWGGGSQPGGGGPPQQQRHVHDSIRPIRLTVALGLKILDKFRKFPHCFNELWSSTQINLNPIHSEKETFLVQPPKYKWYFLSKGQGTFLLLRHSLLNFVRVLETHSPTEYEISIENSTQGMPRASQCYFLGLLLLPKALRSKRGLIQKYKSG